MPIMPDGKFVLREDLISDIASYRSLYGRVIDLAKDRIKAANSDEARQKYRETIDWAKSQLARVDGWEAAL